MRHIQSALEYRDNISDVEIREMEGVFRQLYRFDRRANSLNKQQTLRSLTRVRKETELELGVKALTRKSLGVK